MLNKIELIKKIRMEYGFDLIEAKDIVEQANCDEIMIDALAKAAANGRGRRRLSTSSTVSLGDSKAPYSPFNF